MRNIKKNNDELLLLLYYIIKQYFFWEFLHYIFIRIVKSDQMSYSDRGR